MVEQRRRIEEEEKSFKIIKCIPRVSAQIP